MVAWIYPGLPAARAQRRARVDVPHRLRAGLAGWNRWADCWSSTSSPPSTSPTLADAGGVDDHRGGPVAGLPVRRRTAAWWPCWTAAPAGSSSGADARAGHAGGADPRAPADGGTSCRSRLWRVTACDLDRAAADDFVSPRARSGCARWPVTTCRCSISRPSSATTTRCSATSYLDPTRLAARPGRAAGAVLRRCLRATGSVGLSRRAPARPRRGPPRRRRAAPAMATPSRRSPSTMPRRAAHWVQTVTRPPATTTASRSASGVARSRTNSSARPGTPNHAASPVSQSDTSAPLADGGRGDRERLVAPLRILGTAGDLDDE